MRAIRGFAGFLAAAVAGAVIFAPNSAQAGISAVSANRVALILGNAGYVGWDTLDGPVSDAKGVAQALQGLGFEVILRTDADLPAMQAAIKTFRGKLKKGGVGLFYYSGHGVQVDLVNYLIPTRGTVRFAEDIPNVAVDLNSVLRAMGDAGAGTKFVILDASRDNPLKRRGKRKVRGLARMDAPKGTLIAYAAGPNRIAGGETRGNSLYTAELLKVVRQPGLQVEEVFKRVRARVDRASAGAQIPVEFTSLTRDFYFSRAVAARRGTDSAAGYEIVPHAKTYEALRETGLRAQPRSSAAIVASLAARQRVQATGRVRDRDWLRVRTPGGVTGFVPDYLLRLPFAWRVEPHRNAYEVVAPAALRKEPRSAAPLLANLPVGGKLTAIGRVVGMNWLKVIADGEKSGFVHRSSLRKPFFFTVDRYTGTYEATTAVKLMAQPLVSSRQVASLSARERVAAIGKARGRGWLKVRRKDGAEGFVPEALLAVPFDWREKRLKNQTYRTVGKAALRAEPRSTAAGVARLAGRQTVIAVAKVVGRDWLKVRYGKSKKEGYVPEKLLQLVVIRPDAAQYKDGAAFRDCPACPLMVVIPAGKFVMGSDARKQERPAHVVEIKRKFAIGKFEVTFREWDACAASGGCRSRPAAEGWGRGTRPVVNVTWDDAREYLRWLSGKTGERYHLPSESQWEYAARAGQRTDYAWGKSIGSNRANCDGCGSKFGGKQTAPVGSFKANAFGLHDMHGNVWEWVEDCWHRNYKRAPKDGSAWTSGACGFSVLRGGSWRDKSDAVRSSNRTRYQSAPHKTFGFRAARIVGG